MSVSTPDFSALVTNDERKELDRFPIALRELLFAELSAGNTMLEIGHSYPAAPAGAYVLLAKDVSTRERASSEGISFYERNTSQFFGEYADDKRHFLVLEPPRPAPEEPDMDAIRAAIAPPLVIRETALERVRRLYEESRLASGGTPAIGAPTAASAEGASQSPAPPDRPQTAFERFDESREMNYERWHDGIGYDMDAFAEMSLDERISLQATFIPPQDWRDIEALLAIDSQVARDALVAAAKSGGLEMRLSIMSRAPQLFDVDAKTKTLLQAVDDAAPYAGLSATLDEIEEFHPPEIQIAMFKAVLNRDGDIAYHMATSLAVIHGKISSRYDWTLRPMILELNTTDRTQRRKMFVALCDLLDVANKPELAEIAKMAEKMRNE